MTYSGMSIHYAQRLAQRRRGGGDLIWFVHFSKLFIFKMLGA
jgi:hypothetical protein